MATTPRSADDLHAARQAQLISGVGAVLLTVVAAGAGAMALDSGLELAGWARGLLLAAWLGLAGGLVWQWVVKPLSVPLPKAGPRPTIGAAARAAFAAVALLTPLGFIPGAGERVRRFLLPWYTPLPDAPFQVVVSSGNPVVARGQSVTLAAYLDRVRPNGPLPETATIVLRSNSARVEWNEPMIADGSGAFRFTRPAADDDIEYCVEAGGIRSDWHTVAVADPVELAPETALQVRPPEYADGIVPSRSIGGFRDFEAMPAGRVTIVLRLNRPAADARLEWRPAASRTDGGGADVPLRLEPDRAGGSVEFVVPGDGRLVLTLTGDRGLRTEWQATVRVTADAPPQFETVAGVTAAVRDARPDDRVPIELAVRDDVRIASVRVEYRIVGREADVRSEAIPLPGLRTNRVEGAFAFPLAGKVRENEAIQFRLRVADNRSAPALRLAAQDAVFPPDGWATVRITPTARPLAEQEIFGQRDRVRTRLAASVGHATEAAKALAVVRDANAPDGPLAVDHIVRLRTAADEAGQAMAGLDDIAAEVGLTPTLRPFGEDIKALTADPIRATVPLLKSAEADAVRSSRAKSLADASARLASALSAAADLAARNEALAATRFDRHRLLELTADQLALADDVGRPEAKPAELAARQQSLSARLSQLVAGSELLRTGTALAAHEELRTFHSRARTLAGDQTALHRAIAETDQRARALRLEDLLRQQRELADRAARFGTRTETAVRIARAAPLPRAPFDASMDRLTTGKAIDALSEQVRAAWELDRLAEALARATEARRDRREAARQVAQWQDDLRSRLDEAVRKAAGAALPDDVRKPFAVEQRAIRDAAERLRQSDPALAKAEAAVRAALAAACDALDQKPAEAPAAVKQAAVALDKYAELTPGAADRVKRAKTLLDQVRRDQAALAREADDAIATAPKPQLADRLETVAKGLTELAARVRALDLPGHEVRRDAAAAAAVRTADDLRAGFTADVPISQPDLQRRLDRLRQAADGQAPADEAAVELARSTKALAATAGQLPPRPTADELKPLQQAHREIQRQLAGLAAPEYAAHVSDVRRAVEETGAALRPGEPVIELRRASRRAADAATVLAERLAGTEPDAKRVARLARERAEQAADVPGIDRQLEELTLVRAGKAGAARKAAVDALKLLRQTTDADRRPALQRAADALQRFATELAAQEDQGASVRPAPPRADADDLRTLTGNGRLPAAEDAATARELARLQTTIRNATSEAAADLARGVRPAERDELGPLAKEVEDFRESVRSLPHARGETGKTVECLSRAVSELRNGRLAAAQLVLAQGAEQAGGPTEVVDRIGKFARKLDDLSSGLERLRQGPAVETARHRARQTELMLEADRLAEAIEESGIATDPEAASAKAMTAIRQVRAEMAQAGRDADGERPAAAFTARARAIEQLTRAASTLGDAVSAVPPSPRRSTSAAVGEPLRQADRSMRRAEAQLVKPNETGSAVKSMQSAGEAMSRAVAMLTESMTKPTRDRE